MSSKTPKGDPALLAATSLMMLAQMHCTSGRSLQPAYMLIMMAAGPLLCCAVLLCSGDGSAWASRVFARPAVSPGLKAMATAQLPMDLVSGPTLVASHCLAKLLGELLGDNVASSPSALSKGLETEIAESR